MVLDTGYSLHTVSKAYFLESVGRRCSTSVRPREQNSLDLEPRMGIGLATILIISHGKTSMTTTLQTTSCRIARRADKQGARAASKGYAVRNANSLEEKRMHPLLKAKKIINISTLNTRSLNSCQNFNELPAVAEAYDQSIICIQEHRFYHDKILLKNQDMGKGWNIITSSAWKNSGNSTIGGIGILLSQRAQKALNNIETITPRIMVATFNGNPGTTVICCYSPTNTSDMEDVEKFYQDLSDVVRQVPVHNVLIIAGDFNAQLGRDNSYRYTYHEATNRNGKELHNFIKENKLECLNTKFQKKKEKLWTHTYLNGEKATLDYILINSKWKNSVTNCQPYNSFDSVYTDHRVVSSKIRLSLRATKIKTDKTTPFDWSKLKTDENIKRSFTITLQNRYQALQDEKEDNHLFTNEKYKLFEVAVKDAAEETVPHKPKIKRKIPWENQTIIQLRENVRIAGENKRKNPTRANIRKYNQSQRNLKNKYKEEQTKYLNNKIKEIQDASDNMKSSTAWKIVNEISGRKITNKAKLKAENQSQRIKKWEEHFKNLYGKPPIITNVETRTIIPHTPNIKTGIFEIKEVRNARESIGYGKAFGLDEIPPEVWKSGEFDQELLHFCNAVYEGSRIERWTEGCILPFPKKGDLGLPSNYRGITLTCIAAKIYNLMLLKRIRPALEIVLRPNQNGFRPNRSTTGQILTIRRLIEGIKSKNLKAVLTFVDFTKAFDTIHRGKMNEILLAYGIPAETVAAIMMLYTSTKSMVRSPDGDTEFFEILAGVLQGDTLAPFLFILCLDYALRSSADKNETLGFILNPARSSRYPATRITDIDYADDLALTSNTILEANELLHSLESAAREIGLHINAKKTEFMCYNQTGTIISLDGKPIKQVVDFTYLGSNIQSTEKDINIRKGKAWSALNKMDNIWKSDLPKRLKRNFFQAIVESVLVYGSSTWTLTKEQEKTLDGTYTRMLRAALNLSWEDHPTKTQIYGDLPAISTKIRQRRLRFAGHCHRSKTELASKLILWQPKHGKRSRGAPATTYIKQLARDAECSIEDLPTLMEDREVWREMVNEVRETLSTR